MEEKSLQSLDEDVAFVDESVPEMATPTTPVHPGRDANKLSVISQQYDRGNKGYLDDTEKKLRQLDTENQGHLDINKVYELMQEFQTEQRKAMNLKRIVICLAAFAILLCLANIGTSFAAAKLAKDMKADSAGNLIVLSTNDLAGVSSKGKIYQLEPVDEKVLRMLADYSFTGDGTARSPLSIPYYTASDIFGDVCQTIAGGTNGWTGVDK